MRTLQLLLASLLCLAAASCGGGGGGGPAPVAEAADYELVTGTITAWAGSDKDDVEIQDLTRLLVEGRVYDFGLGRNTASSGERKTLGPGSFESWMQGHRTADSYGYVPSGTATVVGEGMLLAMDIDSAEGTRYSDLHLEGLFNHAGGQDLIDITSTYAGTGADFTTNQTINANFTLTGSRSGLLFSISFTQLMRGRYDFDE
jgi:hypothetical protein